VIDYSRPAKDEIFDGGVYEKFLHDRIKVDDKAGQLGDKVKITRDGLSFKWYRTVSPCAHESIKQSGIIRLP
jgi:hypothetical protein